ncbi:MAG: response regulator [Anaerolineales bacterium]
MSNPIILLVEDNPDDEWLMMRALEKSYATGQADIVVVRDGVEALNYLFAEDSPIQSRLDELALVLLDLKLPKIDGLEILQRIRANERTASLPIVVLTTSSEHRDILTSYRLGANSYIRKPVDFQAFTEIVQQLSSYWLNLNQMPPK